uniref:Uncharacterized protein n=1 Tax=Chloropicon primus TaxID=1764295 RepID=A0A7S2T076_9CHLO|mmetsp:Transcript_1881/g.5120  ORF Transcript_1881/g.5120 Transcript_1881/m.5120 type:complete len:108 (+) Transcript_1881:276-599(+)
MEVVMVQICVGLLKKIMVLMLVLKLQEANLKQLRRDILKSLMQICMFLLLLLLLNIWVVQKLISSLEEVIHLITNFVLLMEDFLMHPKVVTIFVQFSIVWDLMMKKL